VHPTTGAAKWYLLVVRLEADDAYAVVDLFLALARRGARAHQGYLSGVVAVPSSGEPVLARLHYAARVLHQSHIPYVRQVVCDRRDEFGHELCACALARDKLLSVEWGAILARASQPRLPRVPQHPLGVRKFDGASIAEDVRPAAQRVVAIDPLRAWRSEARRLEVLALALRARAVVHLERRAVRGGYLRVGHLAARE